jgi:hypothetical protein
MLHESIVNSNLPYMNASAVGLEFENDGHLGQFSDAVCGTSVCYLHSSVPALVVVDSDILTGNVTFFWTCS